MLRAYHSHVNTTLEGELIRVVECPVQFLRLLPMTGTYVLSFIYVCFICALPFPLFLEGDENADKRDVEISIREREKMVAWMEGKIYV